MTPDKDRDIDRKGDRWLRDYVRKVRTARNKIWTDEEMKAEIHRNPDVVFDGAGHKVANSCLH